MNQIITIIIPASIPRELTPNHSRNLHWGQITKVKNELQRTALFCAIDAKNRWLKENPGATLPFEKGLLWYDLIIKDRRSIMDDDGAIAGLKACRDILQTAYKVKDEMMPGAGIIGNDREFVTAQLHWIIDKESAPKIVITVESQPS